MLVRFGRNNYRLHSFSVNRSLATLFIFTVIFLFLLMHGAMNTTASKPRPGFHYQYQTLKGYFMQSEDDTDPSKFNFIKENFGLIHRDYDSDRQDEEELGHWRRFERFAKHLNEKSASGEKVKVLFLGRHGQGWHNVAEERYGTAAWDCYWSMLDGAEGITWSDANLTQTGQDQATQVNELWKLLLPKGIPLPESYYVSPLTRTIETADLSFKDLELPGDRRYRPVIKELLREAIGVHTCDRRSSASHILSTFPHIDFEPDFSEPDPFWTADYREPRSARKYRLSRLLDDIFENDDGVFLSLTSHSGAIGSVLEAVGHRQFALQTGGVIPVLLRAKRVGEQRASPPKEPSEGPPACSEPPEGLPN